MPPVPGTLALPGAQRNMATMKGPSHPRGSPEAWGSCVHHKVDRAVVHDVLEGAKHPCAHPCVLSPAL